MSEQAEKTLATLEDLEAIKKIVDLNLQMHDAQTSGQAMAMAILADAVDLALEKFGGKK